MAMACFATLDSLAKYLSVLAPLAVVLWARYLFQVVVTSAALLPRRGWALFQTRHPWLQVLRGLLLTTTSALAFVSLRTLPVGEFTAILMLTPMLITLAAVHTMGERVSPLRWLLLSGGLLGALMVIQPGADDFKWAMLLPAALVLVNAGFQLLTSYLARHDDPGTMHFYTGAVATLLSMAALPFAWPFEWGASPGWGLWAPMLLLGFFSTLGHYFMILGYGRASPGALTPYLYFQLVFATLAGWLAFSHTPDRLTLMGIALIGVCGVISTWLAGPKPVDPVESEPTL